MVRMKIPNVAKSTTGTSSTTAVFAGKQGRQPMTASNRKRKTETAVKKAKRSKQKHGKNDEPETVIEPEHIESEHTDDEAASSGHEEVAESSSSSDSDAAESSSDSDDSGEGDGEEEEATRVARGKGKAPAAKEKKHVTPWEITSDPGGGPEVCDLLYGFGHHRAREIWGNPTSQSVVKFHTRHQHLDR